MDEKVKDPRRVEIGKKSGEARRAKKNMQELAQMFLDMPAAISQVPQEIIALSKKFDTKLTIGGAILISQIHKAIVNKDTKAAEFVRDTAGQKPTDNVNLNGRMSYIELLKQAEGDDM